MAANHTIAPGFCRFKPDQNISPVYLVYLEQLLRKVGNASFILPCFVIKVGFYLSEIRQRGLTTGKEITHRFCYNSRLIQRLFNSLFVTSKSPQLIPLRQFAGIRYWPTWLGLLFMWGAARLPFTLQMKIGRLLGLLSYFFARDRRHICQTNLRLCFPELTDKERSVLTRKTFISNGMGVMEIAIAWSRNPKDFHQRVTVSGMENLEAAMSRGKGVLLVCAHFSSLEICGSLLTLFKDMAVTYRPNNNPLFDAVMFNGRKKVFNGVFERTNVRQAMRSLKEGNVLWYAPDQDYGAKHSVFVRFLAWRRQPSRQPPDSPNLMILQCYFLAIIELEITQVIISNSVRFSRTTQLKIKQPMQSG